MNDDLKSVITKDDLLDFAKHRHINVNEAAEIDDIF